MFKKIFILMSLVLSICIFAGCSNISASQALTDDEKANIITTIDSILETENLDADTASFIKEKKEEFLSANTYEKQVEILEEINTKLEEKGIDVSIAIPSIEREISPEIKIKESNLDNNENSNIEDTNKMDKPIKGTREEVQEEDNYIEDQSEEAEYEYIWVIDKPGKEPKYKEIDHSQSRKTYWIADLNTEECVYETSFEEDAFEKFVYKYNNGNYMLYKPGEIAFNYQTSELISEEIPEEGHFESRLKEDK